PHPRTKSTPTPPKNPANTPKTSPKHPAKTPKHPKTRHVKPITHQTQAEQPDPTTAVEHQKTTLTHQK
ncbi:hypothetical protein AB0N72_10315, partial [Paenarthrobacter sp. NPDC089307]|uniref:hypothetical protein n=1 Tax=Paenarthrobacter sp. NPDC089307 TaxID=3155181 RepID=UPI003437079E